MKDENARFYKGAKCKTCKVPVTTNSKSGFCRSCCMNGKQISLGHKMPEELKRKLSRERMASKNPNWKGDRVGYNALHGWIKSRFKKPKLCQECHKSKAYDLANKGIYDRDYKNNWEWLCRRCHMLKDGRMGNLKRCHRHHHKING